MRRVVELDDGTAICVTCDTNLAFYAEACKCSPKQVIDWKFLEKEIKAHVKREKEKKVVK